MIHTRVIAGRRLGVVSISFAAAATAAMLVAMPGCAEKKPVAPAPLQQPATAPSPASLTKHQLNALQSSVDALSDSTKALPGRTEAAHRHQMAEVFGQFRQVLPMLTTDANTGAFRQQLEILEQSQNRLSSPSARDMDQPIINTGLRAAANALTPLAAELNLSNSAELIKPINDELHALDAATGPLHRLAATDVVEAETNLMKALAVVAAQRMNLALKLKEAASPQAASSPAAKPAVKESSVSQAHPASHDKKRTVTTTVTVVSPENQLIPTTVPAEPASPPANQPTPRAATRAITPTPEPAATPDMNK